jgi:hypothetical protein
MDSKARVARERVAECERELVSAEQQLKWIEGSCRHDWGPTVDDPIIHAAYNTPAQEGFGSHPPIPAMHVPEKRDPRWRRECRKCGKTEHTTRHTEQHSTQRTPTW